MRNNPFFSVIIPTYNRPQKVLRAIKSVLAQTFSNFEIIVINDCSQKSYNEIEQEIKKYPNILYVKKEKNEHLSSARNSGIKLASGEYFCFLDDDDYFLNTHLEETFKVIKQQTSSNNLNIFYPFSKILSNGKEINCERVFVGKLFEQFAPSGIAVQKEVFTIVGGFNEILRYSEDLEFYIRCFIKKISFVPIKKITVVQEFAIENNNMSGNNQNINDAIKAFDFMAKEFKYTHKEIYQYIKKKQVDLNLTKLGQMAKRKRYLDFFFLCFKVIRINYKLITDTQFLGAFKLLFLR